MRPITAKDWVNPEGENYSRLAFIDNTIINSYSDGYSAYIFGKVAIAGQYSFTVTINRMHNCICLGVIDTQYKNGNWGDMSNRAFYVSDGDCYVGKQWIRKSGIPFKVGENVRVSVNLTEGTVEWAVHGQCIHKVQYDALKNTAIKYVPYIYLNDKEDSVNVSMLSE